MCFTVYWGKGKIKERSISDALNTFKTQKKVSYFLGVLKIRHKKGV